MGRVDGERTSPWGEARNALVAWILWNLPTGFETLSLPIRGCGNCGNVP